MRGEKVFEPGLKKQMQKEREKEKKEKTLSKCQSRRKQRRKMANVKNRNKKPSPAQSRGCNICPAQPLAKGPFPLKSPFLASVIVGTQSCPWTGLRSALGDPLGSAMSPIPSAGTVAAGSALGRQSCCSGINILLRFLGHMWCPGCPRRSQRDCVAIQPLSPLQDLVGF